MRALSTQTGHASMGVIRMVMTMTLHLSSRKIPPVKGEPRVRGSPLVLSRIRGNPGQENPVVPVGRAHTNAPATKTALLTKERVL